MAKIIKQRERVCSTITELNFYEKETGEVRFGFPIVNGEIKPLSAAGKENYLRLLNDNRFYSVIEERTSYGIESAIAICECGKEIYLNYDAEECPYCGRLHNLFGQELRPRKYWEEW